MARGLYRRDRHRYEIPAIYFDGERLIFVGELTIHVAGSL